MPYQPVITCEHASNHLPQKYALLFGDRPQLLKSHCAYDPGARELAQRFAGRFNAPCFEGTVSRLLVDCNRSPGHRRLFGHGLEADERAALLHRYYLPFRQAAAAAITAAMDDGRTALHLSVHTFTPTLDGTERRADVGLLYDPRRTREKSLCAAWIAALREMAPRLRLRRNYPYRGVADGFATLLRTQLGEGGYLGIELEVNQRLVNNDGPRWQAVQEQLVASLASATGAP